MKLLYCFKPKQCKKNQILVHEGPEAAQYCEGDSGQYVRYLYLVKSGEFEVYKKIRPEKPPKEGVLNTNLDPQKIMSERYQEPSTN